MSPRRRIALWAAGILLSAGVVLAQPADPPPAPPPAAQPPAARPPAPPAQPAPPPAAAQPAPEGAEPAPAQPADEAAEDDALDQELDDIAADEAPGEEPATDEPPAAHPAEPGHGEAPEHGATPEHGAAPAHGGDHGGKDAHGEEHAPTFKDINWAYGFVGEKEGVEPSLLWRPKGMPVPFLAHLFNSAILFYLLIRYGARPVSDALKKRKAAIMHGIDEAAKMKKDAEARLAGYEEKLQHIDDEIERVKQEIREAGQVERERILREARERRARMERDAQTLIGAELKAARDALLAETVRASVSTARDLLSQKLTPADQQRMADEFLNGLNGGSGAKS